MIWNLVFAAKAFCIKTVAYIFFPTDVLVSIVYPFFETHGLLLLVPLIQIRARPLLLIVIVPIWPSLEYHSALAFPARLAAKINKISVYFMIVILIDYS